MKTILFIHGAWHNESCWNGVIEELKKQGIKGERATIAGNEPDATAVNPSYSEMVDSIVKKGQSIDGSFTIVAHSSAGHIVQHAAPRMADKVEQIIFNNAWLLPDGMSQFDLVPDEGLKGMMRGAAEAHPRKCIPMDEGFFRNALAQDADQETQDKLLSILVPQPLDMMEAKAEIEDFQRMDVPMSLLYCKDDISLPDGAYIGMFKQTVPNGKIHEIEGGHETLFLNPAVYVKGLLALL